MTTQTKPKVIVLNKNVNRVEWVAVLLACKSMGIKLSNTPPEDDEALVYYGETQMLGGASEVNLKTLKESLADDIEVLEFNTGKDFTDKVGDEFGKYVASLSPEQREAKMLGMIRTLEALADPAKRSELVRAAMSGQIGKASDMAGLLGRASCSDMCGDKIVMQGTIGGQVKTMEVCLNCAVKAIEGSVPHLKMFRNDTALQFLLMALVAGYAPK